MEVHTDAGLIGQDPLRIEAIARNLTGYLYFGTAGAEVRENSAIDIALWDTSGFEYAHSSTRAKASRL